MSHSQAPQSDAVMKLGKMIKGIKFAMLTTVLPDGSLRSRPMATQDTPFDGELYFLTKLDSAKSHEIDRDHQVNLAYGDPDSNRYVSVSGIAHCFKDRRKAEELWNPFYKAWFPQGLDDPSLAVLRVHVNYAEYWDSPSNMFVHVAGFIKATVTGQEYHPGDNQKLTLDTPPGEATPTQSSASSQSSSDQPGLDSPTRPHGDPLAAAAGLETGPVHQGSRHGAAKD